MSHRLEIILPDEAMSVLRVGPEEFLKEMRLAAAAKWYELGRISQGKAVEICEVGQAEFIDALRWYQVSQFHAT